MAATTETKKTQPRPNSLAPCSERTYVNEGNADLLALIPDGNHRVLDIGCGAGDNARGLRSRGHEVWGVTISPSEAQLARQWCEEVIVADVEKAFPRLPDGRFDAILFSHILEHLQRPRDLMAAALPALAPAGRLYVAVPNMAHWRLRVRFLKGDWTRPTEGPMDSTHIQFWSFHSIRELFHGLPLEIVHHGGSFSIPLSPLRGAMPQVARWLDDKVGSRIPNFSAGQTLIVAQKLA